MEPSEELVKRVGRLKPREGNFRHSPESAPCSLRQCLGARVFDVSGNRVKSTSFDIMWRCAGLASMPRMPAVACLEQALLR